MALWIRKEGWDRVVVAQNHSLCPDDSSPFQPESLRNCGLTRDEIRIVLRRCRLRSAVRARRDYRNLRTRCDCHPHEQNNPGEEQLSCLLLEWPEPGSDSCEVLLSQNITPLRMAYSNWAVPRSRGCGEAAQFLGGIARQVGGDPALANIPPQGLTRLAAACGTDVFAKRARDSNPATPGRL